MDDLCWLNGSFLPLREARVSAEDRGFNFADGVYEVFRIYPSGVFRLDLHLARLRRSCDGIELSLPLNDLDITAVVDELHQRSGLTSAFVYLQVTRGAAARYHSFPVDTTPTVMMSIKPLPTAVAPGASRGQILVTVPDDRWQRCWIKSIALLPNILAKRVADQDGADEALFVDNGAVQEGASSNIFIVRANKLVTPAVGPKVLPGVTRDVILAVAKDAGVEVEEGYISLSDVLTADEAFISSTTRELAWVKTVDGQTIGNGECGSVTRLLHAAFQELTCGRRP